MSMFDMTDEDLVRELTPIAYGVQKTWDEGDYEKHVSNYSKELKQHEHYSEECFNKQRNHFLSSLGTLIKMEFVLVHRNPDNIIVEWKKHCSKSEYPILILYSFIEVESEIQIQCISSFWWCPEYSKVIELSEEFHQLDDSKVLSITTPMVESMQRAWDEDNYNGFISTWSDETKENFTKDEYERQRNILFPKLGAHKSIESLGIHRAQTDIIVQWKMYCEKRSSPVLLVYTFADRDNALLITGCSLFE